MNNPNESKYFDEEIGCTLNFLCVVCQTPIWCPERVHTTYHGKRYLHGRCNMVMSVRHMDLGLMCEDCFGEHDDKQ